MNFLRQFIPIIKLTLFVFFFLAVFNAQGQSGNTVKVEPVGVYKQIDLANDIRICTMLADSTSASRNVLIDSVETNANIYTPPVLYFLSAALFQQKKYDDACYWFYVAQLRARYDVNRCTDKTANAANYNLTFGPQINSYATKDINKLKEMIKRVVSFVKDNEELYDPRWINLSGMGAIKAGLNGKTDDTKLTADKKDWPEIKRKTLDDYYQGFLEFLPQLENKQKTVVKPF